MEGPVIEALTGGNNYAGVKYAVRSGRFCLGKDLEFQYEISPSNRDGEFFEKFRFDSFEEAVNALEKFDEKHKVE